MAIKIRRILAGLAFVALLVGLCSCRGGRDPPVSSTFSSSTDGSTSTGDSTVFVPETSAAEKTTTEATRSEATTKKSASTNKVTVATTTKAPANKKYTNPYGIYHVLKSYIGSGQISKEQMLTSVAYMVDGKIKDFLFDTFIFLPSPNHIYYGDFNTAGQWMDWVEKRVFKEGFNLDALNQAAGDAGAALGRPDYKAKVLLTLVNPNPEYYKAFGEVNGKALDFTREEDRMDAVKWLISEYLSRFKARKYKNVELAGFYWFDEYASPNDAEFIKKVNAYIHSIGYINIFSPFGGAIGYNMWKEYGFDFGSMQPNFYPNVEGGKTDYAGGVQKLIWNAQMTKMRDMGVEMELYSDNLKASITCFKYYMKVGVETGHMNGYHVYYIVNGPAIVYNLQKNKNAYFRSAYDELYKYIKGVLKAEDIWIEE